MMICIAVLARFEARAVGVMHHLGVHKENQLGGYESTRQLRINATATNQRDSYESTGGGEAVGLAQL